MSSGYLKLYHKDFFFIKNHDQEASLDDLLELHNDKFFFPPTAVIDGELLPKLPHEVVAEGGINTREIIIGANKDEGLLNTVDLLVNPDYFYDFVRNSWSTVGPMALFGKRAEGNISDITEQDINQAFEVLEHSIGYIDNFNSEHFDNITDIMTDLYWFSTHTYAELLSQHGVSVYQYLFTYKGRI